MQNGATTIGSELHMIDVYTVFILRRDFNAGLHLVKLLVSCQYMKVVEFKVLHAF